MNDADKTKKDEPAKAPNLFQPQEKKKDDTYPTKFHIDHDMYWPRLGF